MREPLAILLVGRAGAMKTVFRKPSIGYGIFQSSALVVYRPGAAIRRSLAEFSAAIAACESEPRTAGTGHRSIECFYLEIVTVPGGSSSNLHQYLLRPS
jgi:hypothetical protein